MRLFPLPVQFTLFLGLQVALSVGLLLFLQQSHEAQQKRINQATEQFIQAQQSLDQLQQSHARATLAAEQHIISMESGSRIQVDQSANALKDLAEQIERASRYAALRNQHGGLAMELAANIRTQADRLIEAAERAGERSQSELLRAQQRFVEQTANIHQNGFIPLRHASVVQLHEQASGLRRDGERAASYSSNVVITFIGAQILLLGLIFWLLSHQISSLAKLTRKVVAGDKVRDIPHQKRHDALGKIARAVQQFQSSVIALSNSREQMQAILKRHETEASSRKKAEKQLELTASIFDEVQEAVIVTDVSGYVERANPAAFDLLGVDHITLNQKPILNVLLEASSMVTEPLWQHVMENREWASEVEFTRETDNKKLTLLASVRLIGAAREKKGHVIVVLNDITEIRQNEQKMRFLAEKDPATGLFNRAYFTSLIDQHLAKHPDQPLAVIEIKVGAFNTIDETIGRTIAEQSLKTIAEKLSDHSESTFGIARTDADKLAFVQQGTNEQELQKQATALVKRILKQLEASFEVSGYHIEANPSLAVAHYPLEAQSGDDLLRVADIGINRVVEQGGGVLLTHAGDYSAELKRRFALQQALPQALQNREIRVVYQPQINLANGKLTGFEVLMRWRHNGEWISPGEFIPLAEDSGEIAEFTNWAMLQACKRVAEWRRYVGQELSIAINIPPQLLLREHIEKTLLAHAKAANLPPSSIVLEITESSFGQDPKLMVNVLHRLAMAGFGIAIDDFGTGHSSLAYISSLPVTKIKIDKVFVDNIAEDTEAAKLLESILVMAETMEFDIVIEGVETKGQMLTLKRTGRRLLIQGFYFSKPESEEYWDATFYDGSMPDYDIPDVKPQPRLQP